MEYLDRTSPPGIPDGLDSPKQVIQEGLKKINSSFSKLKAYLLPLRMYHSRMDD
jgi:hypothetical protein